MTMPTLPEPEIAREWLATMTLIRRFEERAGEMYARAKIGGFLHLSIGEEATIVGSARALLDSDYLVSTYRSHGYALARGTPPEKVMAELFGRTGGCCGGHGGSMHMFDAARRFMGGYGIVGGNLPIAAGIGLASDYNATGDVTLCTFGDGATNQGTFGETLNLAALWRLPVVFMVINNQFGMGTSLQRHSAVTDLQRKGESLGVPGMRCDGMDVLDTHAVVSRGASARARRAQTGTDRGRHLPLSRPFDGRPGGVPHQGGGSAVARARPAPRIWRAARRRDDEQRADSTRRQRAGGRSRGVRRSSPFPPRVLYDDVYVLEQCRATATRSDHRQQAGRRVARTSATMRSLSRSRRTQVRGALPLMAELRYREALNAALREELKRDERVLLMGEDIGVFGGAFKVTAGLLEEFGERRVRDTPISENTIVGVGVGAAMSGLRPVVELMTVNFALLAFDQIVNNAAHIRYMFGGQVTVPLVIRMPQGAGHQLGPTHSHCLEAMFLHVPGLLVAVPSTRRRRQGPAEDRDPRREPGDLHRARVALRRPWRGARGR